MKTASPPISITCSGSSIESTIAVSKFGDDLVGMLQLGLGEESRVAGDVGDDQLRAHALSCWHA